jgi:hypothetical protein
MWPFKKKKHEEETPEQAAALAELDAAVDEAGASGLDEAIALRRAGGGRAPGGLGIAAGLGMAGAFDRERLLEKADEAEEDAKP